MSYIPNKNEWCWNTEDKLLIKIICTYKNIRGCEDEYLYITQFSNTESKGFFSLSKFEKLSNEKPSFLD